jgi:hypothetical protein
LTLLEEISLNSEVEDPRIRTHQCGAGFPPCRFAGLSSPASGRLESRPNWQTRMSAPRKQLCLALASFGIPDKPGSPFSQEITIAK